MSAVNDAIMVKLTGIFQDRVKFDRIERKLYSYDVGALPSLIKPFVPVGLAGAVVRPSNEEEIVRLVRLAVADNLPLVARGSSTSGYGGVMPAEGAVVVDMSGMNKVIRIHSEQKSVTVQSGVIWEHLQKKLIKEDLDLRLYPSSLPASTVGGWLAQGGSGFGSFEYGDFKDNVLSARVILPTAEVREFSGKELADYIADAEGITGFISEVTLAVRKYEQEVHRSFAFSNSKDLSTVLKAIADHQLPIWSITFLNPESLRLKKKLPHKHGHPYEDTNPHYQPELPEAYVALVAYPESRRPAIDIKLTEIVQIFYGEELSPAATEHEWEQRFSPMRLKRIGPSIIPTEVNVPIDQMGHVLREIEKKIKQPFIMECMLGRGQFTILGFVPHDERSLAYNIAFALAVSVIRIAKNHGGKAYSTGLYFKNEARHVFGKERYERLRVYKAKVDPRNLFNPNKVIGGGFLSVIMKLVSTFEPLIRPFANAAKAPTGDFADRTREKNGIPGNVNFFATACARCGYCVPTCEQFSGRGWESHSPRGKYALIREIVAGREKMTQESVNKFLMCTTCEVCNNRCQLNIPIEHNWMALRGRLITEEKRMTFPPFEMMASSLRGERNIWAGKKEHRTDWLPEDIKSKIKDKADVLYFAGCTASFVNSDVSKSSVRILDEAGIDFTYMGADEACCGIPMKIAGKWDLFEEIFEHNVSEAKKRGAKTIVTSCPACGLAWKELYANLARKKKIDFPFEIKHYSEIAAEALAEGKLHFKHEIDARIAFHDSCHMGRAQGVYEPPREVLSAIPGVELVEMEHNREEGLCCGSVLTLIGEMPVAPKLGGNRIQEAIDVKADALVALCPCCQVQLRNSAKKNNQDMPITDLARIIAKGLGFETEDKTDYSLEMWGYFEKFIVLMYPENMAKIMAAIFPQMFANMPVGIVPMMKAMKIIPGGLTLMAKMMPRMMPLLVPGLMPKVMPDMLAEVSRRVGPLPDDMEELMPDLLPKTMDALMPNMLPLLVPYVTPMMIEYIRTGNVHNDNLRIINLNEKAYDKDQKKSA